MNVAYQMVLTIDLQVYNLLDMKPSEIDPFIKQFGEFGSMIGEAIESHNQIPEAERKPDWATLLTAMDVQMSELAICFQMLCLARQRAVFFNPDPESEGGTDERTGTDDSDGQFDSDRSRFARAQKEPASGEPGTN